VSVALLSLFFIFVLTSFPQHNIPSFMSRAIQASFDDPRVEKHRAFGGTLLKKAKNRHDRPVSSKHPMHLVLKSTQAKGRFGFGTSVNAKKIRSIIDDHCSRYGVKKIQYSNNFNHLHLMVKFPSRRIYLKFIRSLTASIALAVSGASKLKSLKSIFGGKKFWDFRPFSRVVFGWRGYTIAKDYVILNQLEALEILPKRKGRLRDILPGERHYFSKPRVKS
jgi:putative transposase